MKVEHYINGEKTESDWYYKSKSPFSGIEYEVEVPSFQEKHEKMLLDALEKKNTQSLDERIKILETLKYYNPKKEVLEAACKMTGIPISLIKTRIEEGKEMALHLAESGLKEGRKRTVFVGISPNDPREIFYFLSHLVISGNPSILKLSKREPVLSLDVIDYMGMHGLAPGLINAIHGNTADKKEQEIFSRIIKSLDTLIVMGDAYIRNDQISFCAEHSRGLVLDSSAASPHLKKSIVAPGSCLAEHNYLVVGRENYIQIVKELGEIYARLRGGDIMDIKTTRGLIDDDVLSQVAEIVSMGRASDIIKVLYPRDTEKRKIDNRFMEGGAIVEHYSEDPEVGVNPMMDTKLPLYLTGVRYVPTIKDALRDLYAAQRSIGLKNHGEKSMALSIYKNKNYLKTEELENIAYDIHINESPSDVTGIVHQGIRLNDILTH